VPLPIPVGGELDRPLVFARGMTHGDARLTGR
jgi:hypothetical protein